MINRLSKRCILLLILFILSAAVCFAASNSVSIEVNAARSGSYGNYTYTCKVNRITPAGYTIYYAWSPNTSQPAESAFQPYTSEVSSSNQYFWVRVRNSEGTFSTAQRFSRSSNGQSVITQSVTINDPDVGAIWYQQSTVDANNVFNLESVFYTPLRKVTWGNNSASTGTINESNYIGQLGSRSCSHEILFTVEADGKFISRSDPSKYKEYWITMCPRATYGSGDVGVYWDVVSNSAVNGNEQSPNTRSTGSASIVSPKTNGTTVNIGTATGGNNNRAINTFWIDLALCMDALDATSLQNLEVNNDYYTTITLKWECYTDIQYGNCSSPHSGEYIITLRGYYGTSVEDQDAVSFIVEAEGSSQSLNIRSILNTPTKIATLNILSTNKTTNTSSSGNGTGFNWANNVFAFLSSSSDYSNASSSFVLTNVSEKNRGQTIPFVVQVYNRNTQTLNRSFDGTARWSGKPNARANPFCIDLSNCYNVTTDRYGNTYNALNFLGDVCILISDDGTISANEGNAYSGRYESYIYYHIIYDPS